MRVKNILKNVLALSLMVAVLFSTFDYTYADDSDVSDISVGGSSNPDIHEPRLEISGGNDFGVIKAGKEEKIKFKLKNTGKYTARNLSIELKADPKDEKNFKTKDFRREGKIIKPKSDENFEFGCKLSPATPEGRYMMSLELTYRNNYHDIYKKVIPVRIYVENSKRKPLVDISEVKFENGWIDSSKPSRMRLNLKNNGDLVAKNIEIKLDGLDPKTVYLADDSTFRKVAALHGDVSQLVGFDLQANPDVEGDVELNAIISYYDEVDNKYEETHKILVPTSASGEKLKYSDISMKFSQAEYSVTGEAKGTISLCVRNNGDKDLEDLKLELSSEGGITFMSKYIHLIDKLKAGETKNFSYTVVSSDPESKGSHPVKATLTFNESTTPKEGEVPKSIIEVTGVTCYKKGEAAEGKVPKIIIADYNFTGEKIVAGKEFELAIKVKNTSNSMYVKNIKFTHSSEEEVFIPIDAANSFFIESLPPNGVAEKRIKLTSKPDAAAKMYKMTFTAEYEDGSGKSYDEKGNPFKSEESIVLNLTQEIRLEIPELKIPEFASVGEGISIDSEFYNMGKAPLYNMMVKIEGNFDTDVSNYFVGNFEASRSDMFSCKITPMEAGEVKGKLIFEFEDESGNKDKKVKEFTITVDEGMGMEGMDEDFDPEMMGEMGDMDGMDMDGMEFDENGNPIEKKGLSWMTIAAIVIGAIILIIIFVIVNKKRKKKKLEKLLLETEDEDK